MGGMSSGREAARLAVERMMAAYRDPRPGEAPPQALLRALVRANRAVHGLALDRAGVGQVGTTLVAAVVRSEELYWVSAGDSRLYLYRAADDTLTRCTDDHNYAYELHLQVAAEQMSPEQAAAHPDRQALTSFVGLEEIPRIDRNLYPVRLAPGDRLLLCSDGVYGVLADAVMRPLLHQGAQAAAEALIAALQAREDPGQDNATVAVLGLEGPEAPAQARPEPEVPPHRRRWGHWLVLTGLLLALGLAGVWIVLRPGFGPAPVPAPAPGIAPAGTSAPHRETDRAQAPSTGTPAEPARPAPPASQDGVHPASPAVQPAPAVYPEGHR
jgi:PPM family protein phosphatase